MAEQKEQIEKIWAELNSARPTECGKWVNKLIKIKLENQKGRKHE